MTVMKPSHDDSMDFFESTPKLIVSFSIWNWLCYEFSVMSGEGWFSYPEQGIGMLRSSELWNSLLPSLSLLFALVCMNNQRSSAVSIQAIGLYTFYEAIRPRSPGPSSWLILSGEAQLGVKRGITRGYKIFTLVLVLSFCGSVTLGKSPNLSRPAF